MKKVVCLLSGGLDSTTCLYMARHEGYDVSALILNYGQNHIKEIHCAREICTQLDVSFWVVPVTLPWGGSALLDKNILIPMGRDEQAMKKEIPATYVPARNTIFLSLAASLAEVMEAETIFIGANFIDYSGYPDCRPEYLQAYERMIQLGTRQGIMGKKIKIEAPLLKLSKHAIILLACSLKVPLEKTWSCYQGKEMPCGDCDSCRLRQKGFQEAGMEDPLIYYAASSRT